MADKKKTSAASKNTAKAKKERAKAARAAERETKPLRREIGAWICLLLAGLIMLGLFHAEGMLTVPVVSLFMGLIGAGVYVLPFALLLDFVVLLFHDGYPVRMRVVSSWIVALCVGMLVHLFGCKEQIAWEFPMVSVLWQTGVAGTSGGVLAGLLAMLLALCVHKVGAVIFCFIFLVLFALAAFDMSVGSIIRAIRNRPRAEYAPPVREHRDTAEVLVNHVAQKHIERTERKRSTISDFDLPVDEPVAEEEVQKKKSALWRRRRICPFFRRRIWISFPLCSLFGKKQNCLSLKSLW